MIAAALLLLAAAGTAPISPPATTDGPIMVPARWHLIEGITSDGARIWLTSVIDRSVLALDSNGAVRPIPLPARVGAPFGIAWDGKRQWLWIATQCPAEPRIEQCGTPGLLAIDRAGKVQRTLAPQGAFSPGDVSVDAERGRVFVSDSANGAVFTCDGDCSALHVLTRPEGRASAQGSAVSADGRHLIVADYSRGIVRIDLANGAEQLVKTAEGKRLSGIDGLVRRGGTYVGVYNATEPTQLIAFKVGEAGQLIDVHAIDTGELLRDPTQIALSKDGLLVVADAQWRLYAGPEARGAAGQKETPIRVIPASALDAIER